MISVLPSQRHRALVTCDGCRAEHMETVDRPGRSSVCGERMAINTGQVAAKLSARGWRVAGRKQLCPGCVAQRRAEGRQAQEVKMARAAPATPAAREKAAPGGAAGAGGVAAAVVAMPGAEAPRQPTRAQKREIVQLLDASYDVKAGRYVGGETDQTVAASLPGILPGWVASVREDLYGPAGGNEEIEGLLAELRRELAAMAARDAAIEAARAELAEARGALAGFLKRLEAIRAAVGPKAVRA
ncbi:hypothetical protein C5F48_20310 [Cereibacter changlensis JA139]|uniref:Uncharacterized protein n=2 Tax=Cereibacter changlensis TaxID=402884 RepID=A0A2T4JPU0_9RHOB|nr:hypothetical protein [Cereibacter changlensis]PTE19935.1 hypothetical protein C5F48_20310 [Cereibacter changlensis JA139]PZX50768.1 hypothetical protein LX76_03307 [Cereibacter changlensis]PZX54220.1 hypothetical protein LX76_01863 [Cereibacter changlensis]